MMEKLQTQPDPDGASVGISELVRCAGLELTEQHRHGDEVTAVKVSFKW